MENWHHMPMEIDPCILASMSAMCFKIPYLEKVEYTSYSSGEPQGCMLGPMLFLIHSNDPFLNNCLNPS